VIDVWTIDENVLPVERRAATGRYDLRRRRICGQDLDNGFSGWSGKCLIRNRQLPLEIRVSSPDAGFFQVYSPPQGGLFVAEPVSHANAALNEPEERWPELGLVVLEPGAEQRLAMRFDVISLS
jgi:aldose 1-epimerase